MTTTDDTTTTTETATELTQRQRMIASIRAYADLLEAFPNLPAPWSSSESFYLTEQEARDARRGVYGWTKQNDRKSSYITYYRVIGGADRWGAGTITVQINVDKGTGACRQVVVGTRRIRPRKRIRRRGHHRMAL